MTAIEVEYTATLAQRLGTAVEFYEVDNDVITLGALIGMIASRHASRLHGVLLDEHSQLLPSVVLAVNDCQAAAERDLPLRSADHVLFLSPISGG